MELIVLGSCGTWPGKGAATSGYLLRHDGFVLWLDAGSGTLARLQQEVEIADVGGVLISHGHPDHFVDLYPYFYARYYGEQGPLGVPLFAPPGFLERLAGLLSKDAREALEKAYDVREARSGEAFEIGPFRVRAQAMNHFGLDALGYRIEAGGAALAYTGDAGPGEGLLSLAKGADVLLAEATWQDASEKLPSHLSARQAGEHAAEAGVGRLVLTHIWPSMDREVSRAEAEEAFEAPVEVATEGMKLRIGS